MLSVLVTCIGATIGKTGLIRKPGICNQQINAILPNEFSNSEYIYYSMCSNFQQQQIIRNSSATTLPILNKGEFDSLLYLVPPLNEQVRIARQINNIFEIIESVEKQQKSCKWSEMVVTCHQSCPMPDILLVHHQVYNEIYIL